MPESSVEDQFVIRSFNPDADIPILVSFYTKLGSDPGQATRLANLNWSGHDPTRDRWLVEAPGDPDTLIGYAYMFIRQSGQSVANVIVHPAWQRRGLGSALLARALNRAQTQGATYVIAPVWEPDQAGHMFLRHHGFQVASHSRYLHRPAGIPLAEPEWPPGYTVRPFSEVQDLSIFVAVKNRSYGDMFGHGEQRKPDTVENLARRMAENPDFYPPESIFIAFAPDGDVAGVCKGLLGEVVDGDRKKIVDGPGVVPEHRHLELQRPLTLAVMHWLRQHGSGPMELHSFGDDEKTVDIYRSLGFALEPHNHRVIYRRDF